MYVLLRLAGTARNNKVTAQGLEHAFRNEHNEFRGTLWKGGWNGRVPITRIGRATRNTDTQVPRNTQKVNATLSQEGKNAVTQEKHNNAVKSQEVANRW